MKNIAITVGRFQTPYLSIDHKKLIRKMFEDENDEVVIFIGYCDKNPTRRNPFNVNVVIETIKQYVRDLNKDKKKPCYIFMLPDLKSDKKWCEVLIEKFTNVTFDDEQRYIFYGGRDSYLKTINEYKNIFVEKMKNVIIEEIENHNNISATYIREQCKVLDYNSIIVPSDFNKGIVYSVYNRYINPLMTVDVALCNKGRILLGRKKYNDKYQFIGGFVDCADESIEKAALRELNEEITNIKLSSSLQLIGVYKIDDWRYKNEQEKIFTTFFYCEIDDSCLDKIIASDDIEEIKFFDFYNIENFIENEHLVLYENLIKFVNKNELFF